MFDFEKDLILYHGSKGGIDGEIMPISRVRCDFGKGFYMGTDINQAKEIIVNDDNPYYYKVELKISEIPKDKILVLDNNLWIKMVLANRKQVPEFNNLHLAKELLNTISKYDIVVGNIADDKMREAFSAFADNSLTDEGLFYCLDHVDYGMQVVAKTEYACSKISILEEKKLYGKELEDATQNAVLRRYECRNIVNEAKKKFNRVGMRLFDFIENEEKINNKNDVNKPQRRKR